MAWAQEVFGDKLFGEVRNWVPAKKDMELEICRHHPHVLKDF
jgi:hypothetical protein